MNKTTKKTFTRLDLLSERLTASTERIESLEKENELWKAEAKLWRDMYIQYEDMLEKDIEKAKERITNVIVKIKSLDNEINNKY